jgi:AcrR family transcriptional regulator
VSDLTPHDDASQASNRRPLRVDAQANRNRILDRAEEVFGCGGQTMSTEEVARLAGVGIATVFRHFPTKTDLLQAVLIRRLERLRQQAQAKSDNIAPGEAFFDFFRHLVIDAPSKIAIGEALDEAGGSRNDQIIEASQALRNAVGMLLGRAQRAGSIRADVDLAEVYALLIATSRAAAQANLTGEVTQRALNIIFDGLKPQATSR